MKKNIILTLCIITITCCTKAADFSQKASALLDTIAMQSKKLIQTSKEIAQEFGNDLSGAGTDAQEIVQDIKQQWNEHVAPVTQQIIEAIKDPFNDIPYVIEDLQEMYAVTQGYVNILIEPLHKVQTQLSGALASLQKKLGITLITPK